nr:hypothetical protein [Lysinibacillus timonensis]
MRKVLYSNLLLIMLVMGTIISGCSQEEKVALPENLPVFVLESDFDVIDWERKAVEFNGMMGNENIAGVIGADMPSLSQQKWMWHLWGVDDTANGQLTVVAYHRDTQTVHPILMNGNDEWSIELAGANNGADAHIPTSVKIPEPGQWALLLYIDDILFDILVYEVNA